MRQYSAKLLFQWRPVRGGISRKRRLCEERIVTFPARSAMTALAKAKRLGKSEEYQDSRGGADIFFEFVGILQLIDVTLSHSEGEVWWEIVERLEPSERKSSILPRERDLDALCNFAPDRRRRDSSRASRR